jgi:hypothetical protein
MKEKKKREREEREREREGERERERERERGRRRKDYSWGEKGEVWMDGGMDGWTEGGGAVMSQILETPRWLHTTSNF